MVAVSAGVLHLSAMAAVAQVRGEIIGAGMTRMPVAVPQLKIVGEAADEPAQRFISVLIRDLEFSGLFRVINPQAYIDDPQKSGTQLAEINFGNWMSIGARGLIRGSFERKGAGFRVEARFFDVPNRASLGGLRVSGEQAALPQAAHRMADTVLELLTGKRGPFDSRIAFVSNRGGHTRDIYSYTFDGKVLPLTRHRSVVMEPSWEPGGEALLFTSFRDRKPSLFRLDIASGRETKLASKLGLNVGGTWSPDGKLLAVSREVAGDTDVYLIDFDARTQSKLTHHWGIDVDPSWSPGGDRIAFCSSRSGNPQVFVITVDGGEVTRLTFDGKYNCSPAWSPDGRYIAFAGRTGGNFQIFVMPSTGGTPRQLTFAGSNEDPTWSPDSRFIAFASKRGGRRKLFMVDLSGRWEQQLTGGSGDDSSPSWSRRAD